ncbi:response regulator [Methylobacterium nodulans]|uniref:Two component transcriptional regulator, winged helix family n=1 Tax=Methylobacterium nodulans (strain LMG 21967 / CNCM I-2342 / ORS 2060) TaxID=460265 RepID=B8IFI2_METNO|nr:response regulator [Methylobacterium nodulans]ACL57717.1 two component transcriptional regulator, winged helix family [Methylobacterium nodulans ORS 2060]
MRVLVVEDDAALARGLVAALRLAGLAVDHEADGAEAARLALSEPYSLIVLDVGLPGLSGFEVLRRIRAAKSAVPVMILTARDAVTDRVRGLDLGADDYLLKPFAPAEFEARVRALIRRGQGLPNPVLRCGALSLDRATGTVTLGDEPVSLRRRELAVLTVLMARAGQVVPKERLSGEVFGFDEAVAPNALELYVARLRKKLQPNGPEIRTIRGLGYLLDGR